MNENLLLIICAVGVVALIYLIRYIIAKVVYKGTDAIENKLRQIEPGTRATGNQSLAERLGVPGQNPPAVQSNQTPPRSLFRLSPVTLPISREFPLRDRRLLSAQNAEQN